MYETTFSLNARPFATAPRPSGYVALGASEAARTSLSRILERAAGPGLLIGPAGSGKTLLCHVLAHQHRDKFQVAMLGAAGLCTRRALLQSILFELNLPYRDREEGELRLGLLGHLTPSDAPGVPLLLLVDEAHTLPLRLLEELRMLTNIVHQGEAQVRLVLAGSPALEEHFASPKLESFNQRVAARCYLQSFDRQETCELVRSQIAQVGGDASQIFSDDALDAIYTASDGIPRLINQLCDHALTLAALGGQKQIHAAGIEEAWSDLQQLPTPWQSAESREESHVIEFGVLEETPSPESSTTETVEEELESSVDSDDPIAVIDDLQRKIEIEVSQSTPVAEAPEEQACEEEPTKAGARNEVELVFHPAPNPFAESFAEEEVIFDRFATRRGEERDADLESEVAAAAKAIESELQESLEELAPVEPALSIAPETQTEAESSDEEDTYPSLAEVESFTTGYTPEEEAAELESSETLEVVPRVVGADDPVMPEYGDEITVPEQEAIKELAAEQNENLSAHDDRDVIIVEEDAAHPIKPPTGKSRARRQEYRQLFARLRRG